ncbi:MAG: M14 family metallocarboxypeptidase [Verrucomicrobia bacterium]|nr:M14 family metallocarboxypeptidase [Verrucomicrobiota bacterium]
MTHRLGKNLDGYHGETIDITVVLNDCLAAARRHGWNLQEIHVAPGRDLLAFTRRASDLTPNTKRIYLSAGIHGDEPAAPLAVRQLLQENQWPAAVDLWLCPCLNPTGFPLNRRENADGVDLNRQYLHLQAAETRAHIAWLERQPGFDVCLCLHEDWESHGFYVYELNPDNLPSFAETIVESVSKVCPIDQSPVIEGREAHNGIIRPSADPRSRPEWPEAFYLFTYKTRLSYTLEAPSDFPLPTRVNALFTGVNAAFKSIL